MQRSVTAAIDATIDRATTVVFSIAAAEGAELSREVIEYRLDGEPVDFETVLDQHGTRLHVFDVQPGSFSARYEATAEGRTVPAPTETVDLIRYLRPSRYCESDTLLPTAQAEFRGLAGRDLLTAVSSWVGEELSYVPGSSAPTDGAVQTLLLRQGVCRDYAHLVIALLRALDVPARLASVYAPGLYPMDFHAVAEAHIDGEWQVVDATTLAPRDSLLRIATGRDASDTAFLTNHGGYLRLDRLEVSAVVDVLPNDDIDRLVQLG
ncbi:MULTISPECIES: transglutaminase family protein [unclassified Herbiconiux]|jgi:transglutaminase-like putative cysteine protease|uniref:transglutaminase-like domain-containing protein n=1 Tax=unclassified Herbiconiux TaxID=2618217 RepID=UPI0015632EFC|nr:MULTISPECIES: transglutaminase family protein [unclassified Herbiconiux]MBF4573812.1 transglutaminase family protein [Herbiconiux sp. VKM Ac-1786]NQX33982.1 transglutaminase family protein [Herbiconiux sp. VKM Ac-2851]